MGLVETKRIERLYAQVIKTRKNCRFEDLERLLLTVGFTERKGSGSHHIFKYGRVAVTVPKHVPVKETYVEHVIEIVREVLESG